MKFVIFGLTLRSTFGNAHATLWRGLTRALAERGHRVVFFERDVPHFGGAHCDLPEWTEGELRLYADWNDVAARVRYHLADADVALVTSYCPDAVAATALALESRALRVFYDLDTPLTLDGLESGRGVSYLGPRGLADYDLVLSSTGGRALVELQQRLGARRVAPLYGCADPFSHHRVAAEDRFRSHLAFLGPRPEDVRGTLENLLVKPARRLPQRRFALAGDSFPADFPWTANMSYFRHLAPGQHPALYSSSKLTLHLTDGPLRSMGYCPTGRLFEAAACGAAILSDSWEGLSLFFEPGAEILVVRTADEVAAAIELPDAVGQKLGRKAYERVLDEHTVVHRAKTLEIILENTWNAPEEAKLATDRGENLLVEA